MASRPRNRHFALIADALLQRKQIHIDYHGRSRNVRTSRDISPQRLTHYRDNWYLDAWCHRTEALRSFSLDRIDSARSLENAAAEIPEVDLDAHFAVAYGIFAGPPTHRAILRFNPKCARWVADEQWHPSKRAAMSMVITSSKFLIRIHANSSWMYSSGVRAWNNRNPRTAAGSDGQIARCSGSLQDKVATVSTLNGSQPR